VTITATSIGYIVFLVAAGITAIVSAMLYYHWVRYGVGAVRTLVVMIFYGVGTATLLMALLGLVAQA
jgi:hypothetical protein